jgi:hypothetical protein
MSNIIPSLCSSAVLCVEETSRRLSSAPPSSFPAPLPAAPAGPVLSEPSAPKKLLSALAAGWSRLGFFPFQSLIRNARLTCRKPKLTSPVCTDCAIPAVTQDPRDIVNRTGGHDGP